MAKWQEGRCLVFDDSFEHEAWNHNDRARMVLLIQFWHPDLSAAEIWALKELRPYSPFYREAAQPDGMID